MNPPVVPTVDPEIRWGDSVAIEIPVPFLPPPATLGSHRFVQIQGDRARVWAVRGLLRIQPALVAGETLSYRVTVTEGVGSALAQWPILFTLPIGSEFVVTGPIPQIVSAHNLFIDGVVDVASLVVLTIHSLQATFWCAPWDGSQGECR